jgi:hypothetical protein
VVTRAEVLKMPAGCELDRAVARVMGDREEGDPRPYSTDIRPAWAVLGFACGRFNRRRLFLAALAEQARSKEGYRPEGLWVLAVLYDRFPEAVCKAALIAVLEDPPLAQPPRCER